MRMEYIILHNQQDELSRNVIKQIPWFSLREKFCVLDWYSDENERWKRSCACHRGQPFLGVPPSAFPEINILRADGVWGRIRQAQSLDDRFNLDLYDWQNQHGDCIGGQWLHDVPNTIDVVHPRLAQVIKSVYEKHVFGRILR